LEDHEKLRFLKVCGSQSRNTAGMENEVMQRLERNRIFKEDPRTERMKGLKLPQKRRSCWKKAVFLRYLSYNKGRLGGWL
ncbi:MAG: hypothetical protein ACLTJB_06545, partial [Holdemania filiformis]